MSLAVGRVEEADKELRWRSRLCLRRREEAPERVDEAFRAVEFTGISVYPWKILCQLGLSA
jgi:hypothetical protein